MRRTAGHREVAKTCPYFIPRDSAIRVVFQAPTPWRPADTVSYESP